MPIILGKNYDGVSLPGTLLFRDRFTDSNGTNIASHTPDVDTTGNGWTGETGNADIQSNQLRFTSNVTEIYADAGTHNVIVRVLWTSSAGNANRNSLFIRSTDENNGVEFNFREDNQDWQILGGGINTSGSFSWNTGQTYELRVDANGQDYTFYIDGNVIHTETANEIVTNTHGVGRRNGSDATRLDDFEIFEI